MKRRVRCKRTLGPDDIRTRVTRLGDERSTETERASLVWMTPAEAQHFLGMSKSTFWRRVHDGSIIARRDGPKSYRVSTRAVLDYIQENATFDPAA